MSPLDAASLERLSLAELRDPVGALISEVMRLRADNAALQARAVGDRRRLRARAAALPAGGARPGAGDDGAAGGAAGGDRPRHLQAPGGAAADLAARRPGRPGPRRAARGPGH